MSLGDRVESPLLVAADDLPTEYIPPQCLQRAQSGEGNAIPLPCLQRALIGEGNAMVLTPQRIWARVPSTHLSGLMVDQALKWWVAEPTTLPAPLFVDSAWGVGNPTAFEDLPMALSSPL